MYKNEVKKELDRIFHKNLVNSFKNNFEEIDGSPLDPICFICKKIHPSKILDLIS